ncbi:unnamed protein product [Ilex paraguariensis]|uniref:K Homology domain-containing protein n=1 Tax=Ilex paraguariensis TaxID=185542 RepID=A0ABC8S8E1_9AQUA
MENNLEENCGDLNPKNSAAQRLRRWRQAALLLNASRRLRDTIAKLSEPCEAEATFRAKRVHETVRTAFQARSHHYNIQGVPPRDYTVPEEVKDAGFQICADELASIVEGHDLKKLKANGGVAGVADKLATSTTNGISTERSRLRHRELIYGINKFTESEAQSFWVFVWKALQDMTLMILDVCAFSTLIVDLEMKGWLKGAYNGLGIIASILLVVFVTAVSDYRQSLQLRDLVKAEKKFSIQVTRDGYRQKMSIYDLLPGDIVHLCTGDQVPADGLFVLGYSVFIDKSTLTGESEPVNVDDENPFMLYGTTIQDGSCRMMVTTVGMKTHRGKLVATLSEGEDYETPLQGKLNEVATIIGKIVLLFAVVMFAVFLYKMSARKLQEGTHWSISGGDALEMLQTVGSATTICSDKTGTKNGGNKNGRSAPVMVTGGNKNGKWHNSCHEKSFGNSQASDTVYRILCQSRKIGSVIGKGGKIVKSLREETQAKITVADSVTGSDERVIIIYNRPTKILRKHDTDNDEDPATYRLMKTHCAAQDALLKVHDRIIEEDLFCRMENGDDNENVVTARLLVRNNMVGCLLGKNGDVIQRLRTETGASIRVLPAEHLPTCAKNTDELVQISGKPVVVKQALYEVSTLLHENHRKDKPPFPMAHGGQGFHPPAPSMGKMIPPAEHNANPHGMLWVPRMGRYGNQPSGFVSGDFDGSPTANGGEAPNEFSLKILCSYAKTSKVIGKGGFNMKQLQQEAGASIHVEYEFGESDDCIIRVSPFENPRSRTIEAILQLQNSELSDEGSITTKLLVPSSKVGCILGRGGNVIDEMRRRTRAHICVYSKEDKPKYAAEDEQLVQISGNFSVVKDALAEIASRLRMRYLRDANAGAEPGPVGQFRRSGRSGNLPGAGTPPPAP